MYYDHIRHWIAFEITDKIKQICIFIDDCSGKSSTARIHFLFGILIYTH